MISDSDIEEILREECCIPLYDKIPQDKKIKWTNAINAFNSLRYIITPEMEPYKEKDNIIEEILKQACGIPDHAVINGSIKIQWDHVLSSMIKYRSLNPVNKINYPKRINVSQHQIADFKSKKINISVVVIVYNRFDNIKQWVECWNNCEQLNSNFTIIHNYDNPDDCDKYKNYCKDNTVNYVPRKNIGFDIGAFQDVCRQRLKGFDNNWDMMFWVTDDTIPIVKDFLFHYVTLLLNDSVGASCMHISDEKTRHIRTTGFCIKKNVARKLFFPCDPIITKEDCYQFEHRAKNHMLIQIESMGLKVVMPNSINNSAVWDKNYPQPSRLQEHKINFRTIKKVSRVTFICPIFNSFPEIISSLICQTHKNWELLLIHDGPNNTGINKYIIAINDPRIKFIETENHAGNWGHSIRKWALDEIKEKRLSENADYIVITNADNYHVPVYCEYMLNGFENNNSAIAVYCEKMVHSYQKWNVQNCSLQLGHVDCAGIMIKTEVACQVGWNDFSHSSDWIYFNNIIRRYGIKNFIKVNGCLLIHN